MATSPAVPAVPAVLEVPVTINLGGAVIDLGTMRVEPRAVASSVRAALGNLLDSAAHVVRHNPGKWPRQVWWVGDEVPLPGSLDRGVVVQVDPAAKRYLVDTGKTKPVPVRWSEVDPMASHCSLTVDAVTAAVLAFHARGRHE